MSVWGEQESSMLIRREEIKCLGYVIRANQGVCGRRGAGLGMEMCGDCVGSRRWWVCVVMGVSERLLRRVLLRDVALILPRK